MKKAARQPHTLEARWKQRAGGRLKDHEPITFRLRRQFTFETLTATVSTETRLADVHTLCGYYAVIVEAGTPAVRWEFSLASVLQLQIRAAVPGATAAAANSYGVMSDRFRVSLVPIDEHENFRKHHRGQLAGRADKGAGYEITVTLKGWRECRAKTKS